MVQSDWAALLAAAVQVAYRHDTRPFLSLAKGLARQTRLTNVDGMKDVVLWYSLTAINTDTNGEKDLWYSSIVQLLST